ncbi:MAG TPA: glycosyltransferase family 4 protein [Terriglobia bacterium]|nr:glycosyltransferase family 4 protein [Terriglobia bacterium]
MRACMVAYTFYEADNRVRRYAETLAKRGYGVDVVALRREGQSKRQETINGVRVFRIQRRIKNEKNKLAYLAKLLLFFLRSMFILTREQIKQRYDLIHVHSVPDFEVFAAWYPKLTGSKLILDIHDIIPEFYVSKFNISTNSLTFKLLVAAERMSAAFSDHVIAANHFWQKRLEGRSVDESKLTTILNFPDTQFFQRRGRNRNDNKFIVLYPGSLNYHQGLDLAIRAFSLLKDEVPQAEFHIYGSGEQLEFLKSLIGQLGLQDRVFLKGSLPLDQMAPVMENADLGIVPKRNNGFGNEAFSTKILEFMTMGVPVIVPDTTIDKYYFNDSVALFFQAGNEKSLASAMLLLINNAELRERLVRNASRFVTKYSWDVNQAVYLDLVDSLLTSHNGYRPQVKQLVNGGEHK